MPQSLAKFNLHVVFSTKRRTPWLRDPDVRAELYAYMATILRQLECPAMIINGVEDHVHVLCLLSRKIRIMDLVKDAIGSCAGDTGLSWTNDTSGIRAAPVGASPSYDMGLPTQGLTLG